MMGPAILRNQLESDVRLLNGQIVQGVLFQRESADSVHVAGQRILVGRIVGQDAGDRVSELRLEAGSEIKVGEQLDHVRIGRMI